MPIAISLTRIGQALLGQDRFREAMDYFKLGNDRIGYSEAYALYRREVMADRFGALVMGFLAIIIAV